MEVLKPCPFCGGKADFVVRGTESGNGNVGFGFSIKCTKCSATNSKTIQAIRLRLGADGELHIFEDGRDLATREWNRRGDNG